MKGLVFFLRLAGRASVEVPADDYLEGVFISLKANIESVRNGASGPE